MGPRGWMLADPSALRLTHPTLFSLAWLVVVATLYRLHLHNYMAPLSTNTDGIKAITESLTTMFRHHHGVSIFELRDLVCDADCNFYSILFLLRGTYCVVPCQHCFFYTSPNAHH
jgi:hypothetical protein